MLKKISASIAALALAVSAAVAAPTVPAHAFSSSGSARVGGVTYSVNAWSCNVYAKACSFNSTATTTAKKYMTHTVNVRSKGFKVGFSISGKTPGASLGFTNSTLQKLTINKKATYSYLSGVARPSWTAWAVGAQGQLRAGGQFISTGWTL